MVVDSHNENWMVYILLCSDSSYYTGITTDMTRRFRQHASGRGARYFRGRQPQQVVFLESGHNRSSASRREAALKRLSPLAKRRLVAQFASSYCAALRVADSEDSHD